MREIKPGDIVGRKSYDSDILFRVEKLEKRDKTIAYLRGIDLRLLADAPVEDLKLKEPTEILEYQHKDIEKSQQRIKNILMRRGMKKEDYNLRGLSEYHADPSYFGVPGRVVHIDGDEEYLEKCMRSYKRLEMDAHGFYVPEKKQPKNVTEILSNYTADILVLTGHDGLLRDTKDFSKLENYRNSKYFVEAVKIARKIDPSRDDLAIFAGACQSHYEAILEAGANFASSPQRVLIHAYDPIFVIEKIAYTAFNDLLSLKDVIENTITGAEGIGGIETRGRFRWGYPKSPY